MLLNIAFDHMAGVSEVQVCLVASTTRSVCMGLAQCQECLIKHEIKEGERE